MSTFWLLWALSLWSWTNVEGLSVCTPVDSIFVLSTELIETAQHEIAPFFHDLIYEASSELSGVGVLAFGEVASGFENPLLGLSETIGANTRLSMATIDDELAEAMASAHQLFESESQGRELEAVFVMDLDNDDG